MPGALSAAWSHQNRAERRPDRLPDYDSTSTIGAGCLITDHDGLIFLNSFADEMGFDAISLETSPPSQWNAMRRASLRGRTWKASTSSGAMLGPYEACGGSSSPARVSAISSPKASGMPPPFSERVGEFCHAHKGARIRGLRPQVKPSRGVQYAVGDRGGCRHFGTTIGEQNFRVMADSLVVCTWHRHVDS